MYAHEGKFSLRFSDRNYFEYLFIMMMNTERLR